MQCACHYTLLPLPLLLSTLALQSILTPFNSTCNQLYALQRALRIERAAPDHPARPPQLQRTSPLERASSRLPAPLLYTPPEYIRAPAEPTKQRNTVPPSRAVQFQPELSLFTTKLLFVVSSLLLSSLNTIVSPRSSVFSSILSRRQVRVRASRFQGAILLQCNRKVWKYGEVFLWF